ncbi:AraC family transcriptional regulator [Jiangella rhizosphaerae]|uniref:AraC family transcriptional regulator n=1 Tax=Jiangella rhizosphaerae TaxID=2293569 RepID=A0A418KLC6_9ACTN|nr:AraC family transcriptional regulator [Jiangella rhizosphaerae]RIQ18328.1 AraC family transcriptional regulator [Jiangella rhizosphaerae]
MVDDAATVPVERSLVVARTMNESAELIRRLYIGHEPRLGRDHAGTEFRVVSARAGVRDGPFGADRVHVTVNFRTATEPFGYLFAMSVVHGVFTVAAGGEHRRAGAGDVVLFPPGAPVAAQWADLDAGILRLPVSSAADLATERFGIDPADLRFESMSPVTPRLGEYFRNVCATVGRELMVDDSAVAHPLIAAEMVRTAAAAALATFPNTTMTVAHSPGPGYVAPRALRRAAAYIEAHAAEPITLSDVAAAAGIGPRALQYAFARHLSTTPLTHLRRVRLERAHRELQAADPTTGATVAAIAAAWGFSKPSRFAAEYRQRYGRSPSRTLRT